MKMFSFSLSIILTTLFCGAQPHKEIQGDTAYWHGYERKICKQLHLEDLSHSTDSYHFRYLTDQQAVDIWTTNGQTYQGTVTSFTTGYNKKKPARGKTYLQKISIDTNLAHKAFYLARDVADIPTDHAIKGWQRGLDGSTYIFETSTVSSITCKTYWTPSAQDSTLTDVQKIKFFIRNLDSLLGLKHHYQQFFSSLKPGAYINNMIIITKLNRKQSEYFKKMKPYWNYLDSVKDKLTYYLSDTLTKFFSAHQPFTCNDEFTLLLSKDNALLKVTTTDKMEDREDRMQFNQCRQQIFEAFKQITIGFVHSKVAYHLILSFDNGKATVYQIGYW